MDKNILEPLVKQGLSSRKIGKIVGLSPTGTRYWLKKNSLNTFRSIKQIPPKNKCKICGKLTYNENYCNRTCSGKSRINETKEKIIKGNKVGRKSLRNYFIKNNGIICSICRNTEWNNLPIPVVLDHIDGNPYNNKIDNLRLVCCNCDAQLPTYKGKNKGNGRFERRERYKNGKSY